MAKKLEMTPMMRQYHRIKEEVPDTLLLFRLGDFYELFYEDAVTAAGELEITLTARQKDSGSPVPMCGVPHHAADGYIAKLLRKGYKVAVCDQTEPPKKGVKLVPRALTRIITPGTVTDQTLLKSGENNFLMGLALGNDAGDDALGVAFLDLSTGEFRAFQRQEEDRWDRLWLDIDHFAPKEVVFPRSREERIPEIDHCIATPIDDWTFDEDAATRALKEHFGTTSLEGFGCSGQGLAIAAAGGLIYYARQTQKTALEHVTGLRCDTRSDYMVLDSSSIRNLELLESVSGGRPSDTLLGVVDRTRTGMGARLLRHWMIRPSVDEGEIVRRQDAVEELVSSTTLLDETRASFHGMADIERLLTKVVLGTATPREIVALRGAFEKLPGLGTAIGKIQSDLFRELAATLDPLEDLYELLAVSIEDEPAVSFADGGVIRDGFDTALDELRAMSRDSKAYLASLEVREKERTGIASLKVRFNRVFGYYIEVSKANLHLAPDDYVRKQTLVGGERFVTEELKEYEEKILTAEERMVVLEKELFQGIRDTLAGGAARIQGSAAIVSQCDCLTGLAVLARDLNYRRPEISRDGSLLIKGGRHPVLEALAAEHRAERFVPNDLFMDRDQSRIHIITGPNMGGKSTYLRQSALIVILAQMGSFVPAQFARCPIVDRIFTRIGASDDLARGRSTFMVEMTEAAIILNAATSESLVILDEVGRGTATFDGLSIAWAVIEHLQSHVGAKTLFATHYHELTELAELLPGVANFHVTVTESENRIIFLRKIEAGAADRSYGIEVARLAGLPSSVLDRAREILKKHEETERELSDNLTVRARRTKRIVINQLSLFSPEEEALRARLRDVDVELTSPMEALKLLADLKDTIDLD